MRVFLVILALLVFVAATAGGLIWWKVSGLKQQLVLSLENSLHARVDIASLELDLRKGEVHASGVSLTNQRADAPWDSGEIDQATGYFHVMDLFSPTLPLRVEVSGWKVTLHTQTAGAPAADTSSGTTQTAMSSDGSAPADDRIRVTAISGTEGEIAVRVSDGQPITLHGVMFEADTHGGTEWTTEAQTTSVSAGALASGVGSVHLHSDDQKITFSELTLHCGDGQIAGDGEIALGGTHAIHGAFKATSVPIIMLVAARWQVKLSGLVSGDLTYQSDDTSAVANGKLSVSGARFNLLPWLGKVTSLVGLPDIAGVDLDQATSDFSWKAHVLSLTHIDVRKKDVLRISGALDVAADSQCDGHLRIGLPSTVTARWPKLQTEVFSTALEDYNWADVHITGTPENLQEDLTPRLIAVGAEQGADALKQTSQKAVDVINSLLK
jgi:hypothetical protein